MKNLQKKIVLAVLSGAIMVGSTVTALAAEQTEAVAAEPAIQEVQVLDGGDYSKKMAMKPAPVIDEESYALMEAERLAKDFDVSRGDVVNYIYGGVHPKEIHHACMVAKASGKTLKEVMEIRQGREWPAVEEMLGVSREDIKAQMRELMAKRVAEDAHSDVKTVSKLLMEKYQPRDIEIAGIIACESGKNIRSVLNMKTINKGWWDVAKECGVTYDQVVANHSGHNHMTFNKHTHGGHSNMGRQHGGPRK